PPVTEKEGWVRPGLRRRERSASVAGQAPSDREWVGERSALASRQGLALAQAPVLVLVLASEAEALRNPGEKRYPPELEAYVRHRRPGPVAFPFLLSSERFRQPLNGFHPCAVWLFEPPGNRVAAQGPHCSRHKQLCNSSV